MGGKKRKSHQTPKGKSKTTGKEPAANDSTAEKNSDDWISMLAKKTTEEASTGGGALVLSKAERIERRKAKKRRREERKPTSQKNTQKSNPTEDLLDKGTTQKRKMNHKSEACLQWLIEQLLLASEKQSGRPKPYEDPDSLKRGKATSGSGKFDENMVQPRKRDYGGLGFARPSMFLSLRDPSFIPKLEEEFAEHIPGFFGKQRTKAMKRQLDGNMLWRKLAEKRPDDRKIDGKKLSDMGPDERVEAMIKAGMI